MGQAETSLSTIKARLSRLRNKDRRFRIFGSSHHKYKSIPDSRDDLKRLEQLFALKLPSVYQRFLFEIGHGAGPYYGILSLFGTESEIREWFDLYHNQKAEALANLSLSSPFPVFPVDTGEEIERNRKFIASSEALEFVAEFPCNGCIPICHQGCSFYTVLITAGRWQGSVWDIEVEYGGSFWRPAKRPPGFAGSPVRLPQLSPIPSFVEWFAGWLDQCDADLAGSAIDSPN